MGSIELLLAFLIGLAAGAIGGLAGIGGSVVMLPALGLLFRYESEAATRHHLYMASAMAVNAVVAISARREHARAGALRAELVRVLLPTMAAAIVLGVLVSNQFNGRVAKFGLAGFLFLYCAYNVVTAVRRIPEAPPEAERATVPRLSSIGAVTGFLAGFLGIGGGIVMVPLLQIGTRVPLRQAIAASAGVMAWTSPVGAALKVATLEEHGLRWQDALLLAAPMAVGAVLGATAGAWLTHRLRLPHLKLAISVALAAAAARLAGIP